VVATRHRPVDLFQDVAKDLDIRLGLGRREFAAVCAERGRLLCVFAT
jgi:hypothetical protein